MAAAGGELQRHPGLEATFRRARRLGLTGPVEPAAIITHALGFAEGTSAPRRAVDLGSGAGIPGLVLAFCWPTSRWLLVEAAERRATFLDGAVRALELDDRVEVAWQPAEEAARGDWRARADLVVARSLAPPPVTAELAAGFLAVDGRLIVSEPPDAEERWSPVGDTDLGLVPDRRWSANGATYQALRQTRPCPDRYPRRAGVPAKRPLF